MDRVQGADRQRKRFFGPPENSFIDPELDNALGSFFKGLTGAHNLLGVEGPGPEGSFQNTPRFYPKQPAGSQHGPNRNSGEPVISLQKAGHDDTGIQIDSQSSARSAFKRS